MVGEGAPLTAPRERLVTRLLFWKVCSGGKLGRECSSGRVLSWKSALLEECSLGRVISWKSALLGYRGMVAQKARAKSLSRKGKAAIL